MIARSDLAIYLNDFLSCEKYNDYAPNGIQVEGKDNIQRICTAVTASEQVIARAAAWQADALLVHHGYFWRGEDPVITGMKRQRISQLIIHDISLFAYHLPLDCHTELGNNACLAQLLGVIDVRKHKAGKTENLLWSGKLTAPMSGEELTVNLSKVLGRTPLYISGNHNAINTLAWCSGGAQDFIEDAAALKVDAYLSGEISERTYYQAQELGIHYYSCGHHATERYGIQALGKYLAQQFQLDHVFIDSNNPV